MACMAKQEVRESWVHLDLLGRSWQKKECLSTLGAGCAQSSLGSKTIGLTVSDSFSTHSAQVEDEFKDVPGSKTSTPT